MAAFPETYIIIHPSWRDDCHEFLGGAIGQDKRDVLHTLTQDPFPKETQVWRLDFASGTLTDATNEIAQAVYTYLLNVPFNPLLETTRWLEWNGFELPCDDEESFSPQQEWGTLNHAQLGLRRTA